MKERTPEQLEAIKTYEYLKRKERLQSLANTRINANSIKGLRYKREFLKSRNQ